MATFSQKKLQAAENRVKLLTAPSPYFQQQAFQEGATAEMALPDISYPPRVVSPHMSQKVNANPMFFSLFLGLTQNVISRNLFKTTLEEV